MKKKSIGKDFEYLRQVCIASYQVFLGIGAATIFTGAIDIGRLYVVLFNVVMAILLFFLGWRILK